MIIGLRDFQDPNLYDKYLGDLMSNEFKVLDNGYSYELYYDLTYMQYMVKRFTLHDQNRPLMTKDSKRIKWSETHSTTVGNYRIDFVILNDGVKTKDLHVILDGYNGARFIPEAIIGRYFNSFESMFNHLESKLTS